VRGAFQVISDLLNPSKAQLQIRESPDLGIYIQGVSEVVCKSHTDVMKLITQGTAMRRVAETEMNSESSRSHSIFTLSVEKRTMEKTSEKTKETMLKSKLNLVDLAGSERASKTGATGATLKEGAAINKSLMTLGSVINALGELAKGKKVHVPYRDSKLTRLLQDSIGGNSSTLMLAALSPADYNYAETVITLQYAKRVKMVENKVERNEDVKEKEIRELKEEIEALRAALANGGAGSMGHSFDENTPPGERPLLFALSLSPAYIACSRTHTLRSRTHCEAPRAGVGGQHRVGREGKDVQDPGRGAVEEHERGGRERDGERQGEEN